MEMWQSMKKLKESVSEVMRKDIFVVDHLFAGKRGNGQEVEFTFFAPEAKNVFLAGTFNDWNTRSIPMKKSRDGYWRASIKLPSGWHEYKYFMDGAWAQDISGAEKVPNNFGTYNNVIGIE